jgi:hypothetical protein
VRIAVPLALVVSLAACGDVASPGLGPSSPPSELRSAVERLAPLLAFRTFIPVELPSGPLETVGLVAAPPDKGQPRDVLGEPVLYVQWSVVAGGKPMLMLIEGPSGCCANMLPAGERAAIQIRSAEGGRPELVGEIVKPRSVNEGITLTWHESHSGARTFVALVGTSFGQLDEQGLLRIARSMRVVDVKGKSDALLLYVSTHVSHSATGHRVYVAAKSGAVPDEARLLDTNGSVMASAAFEAAMPYGCLTKAAGVAALAVPKDVVEKFGQIGTGYRVEARVGNAWRQVQLVSSGCASIE